MGLLRRWFGRKYIPPLDNPDGTGEVCLGNLQPETGIYTGTSTIVVYDLGGLKHRLDDDVDWWADPVEELVEIRQRNLLIVGLGADGFYDIEISEADDFSRKYSLSFPSGRVFIGPGEMLTGGGGEPDPQYGGKFLDFQPGDYTVGVERVDDRLWISFSRSLAFENNVSEPISIF